MGHRFSKNQHMLSGQKNNKVKEKSNKKASRLRTSITIRIRMLKMESKDLNNLIKTKSDRNDKCTCSDENNGQISISKHSQITKTLSSSHCFIQPDNHQSIDKLNEETQRLEDRINQISNDNSAEFVARRNQYNHSNSNINNNVISDNEISSKSSDCRILDGKKSIICDNSAQKNSAESDRIQMELKNIGVNNYKRSNLLMNRCCDNKIDGSPIIDRNNSNVRTSNASICASDLQINKTTTPSTSKGPDYVPMAPIKSSDKNLTEQTINTKELSNTQKKSSLPVDEMYVVCQVCLRSKERNQICFKCVQDAKESKDKESKSKKANWSKKFSCVKMLSPKSTSHANQQSSCNSKSARQQNNISGTISNRKNSRDEQMEIRQSFDPIKRLLNFDNFNPLDYPIEDCDEVARAQRAREIHEGVDLPPGHHRTISVDPEYVPAEPLLENRLANFSLDDKFIANQIGIANNGIISDRQLIGSSILNNSDSFPNVLFSVMDPPPRVHSQVDFIHCLVPDLRKITNCGFYWGKMDRYEAERLLEGKPEGTFLLRDSAQEEFLFSVSFRKYGRSLHARIEQFNHKFSFDCHDPGVFTSPTVTGLLEHYKDPACVMFFEPALTQPLNRNFCFSLQQLCRSLIVSHTTYDGINDLTLPSTLKSYLKEYHYKQRVRVRRYEQS